jgi:hypothetical protein
MLIWRNIPAHCERALCAPECAQKLAVASYRTIAVTRIARSECQCHLRQLLKFSNRSWGMRKEVALRAAEAIYECLFFAHSRSVR